jgi:hypothetical protein
MGVAGDVADRCTMLSRSGNAAISCRVVVPADSIPTLVVLTPTPHRRSGQVCQRSLQHAFQVVVHVLEPNCMPLHDCDATGHVVVWEQVGWPQSPFRAGGLWEHKPRRGWNNRQACSRHNVADIAR